MAKKQLPLISFIIPVYNVEKYIKRCVESVLNQNYNNIEIILVNDGSKDNSRKIIEGMLDKSDKIRLINKENCGVSSARTEGLKHAKGEFVLFLDSDDYIETDYAEYFYGLINTENHVDVAMNYNKYSIYTPYQVKKEKVEVLSSEKVMEYIYTSKLHVAVWNKIYRRSFFKKNHISFNKEIWYGEGMLFNIQCLQYTDKVVVGNRRVYHQVYNDNSAMRDFKLDNNLCGLRSLDLQRECWKNEHKNVLYAWEFHKWCFNMSILKGIIGTYNIDKYKKEYQECKNNLRKGWYYPFRVNLTFMRKCFYLFSSMFPVCSAKLFLYNERKKAKRALN